MKVIHDTDNHNKFYLQLPDGYRLIYEDGEYVGRYNPELNSVI